MSVRLKLNNDLKTELLTSILVHVTQIAAYQGNAFHTERTLKALDPDNYLFSFMEKDVHPGRSKEFARGICRDTDERLRVRNSCEGIQGRWGE